MSFLALSIYEIKVPVSFLFMATIKLSLRIAFELRGETSLFLYIPD